jgi:hypothetical protein
VWKLWDSFGAYSPHRESFAFVFLKKRQKKAPSQREGKKNRQKKTPPRGRGKKKPLPEGGAKKNPPQREVNDRKKSQGPAQPLHHVEQ